MNTGKPSFMRQYRLATITVAATFMLLLNHRLTQSHANICYGKLHCPLVLTLIIYQWKVLESTVALYIGMPQK